VPAGGKKPSRNLHRACSSCSAQGLFSFSLGFSSHGVTTGRNTNLVGAYFLAKRDKLPCPHALSPIMSYVVGELSPPLKASRRPKNEKAIGLSKVRTYLSTSDPRTFIRTTANYSVNCCAFLAEVTWPSSNGIWLASCGCSQALHFVSSSRFVCQRSAQSCLSYASCVQ
jgi:hypothetical protein